MAKKFVPNITSWKDLMNYFYGNSYSDGFFPDAIAFDLEEIYPNGAIEIHTYDRGGGMSCFVSLKDALKLVSWCRGYEPKIIETYFVINNFDSLERFR